MKKNIISENENKKWKDLFIKEKATRTAFKFMAKEFKSKPEYMRFFFEEAMRIKTLRLQNGENDDADIPKRIKSSFEAMKALEKYCYEWSKS